MSSSNFINWKIQTSMPSTYFWCHTSEYVCIDSLAFSFILDHTARIWDHSSGIAHPAPKLWNTWWCFVILRKFHLVPQVHLILEGLWWDMTKHCPHLMFLKSQLQRLNRCRYLLLDFNYDELTFMFMSSLSLLHVCARTPETQ